MIDIRLVKSDQRGEAHNYYDILIHCELPPALAEELMVKINKSMKALEIIQKLDLMMVRDGIVKRGNLNAARIWEELFKLDIK